ncbi:MAG: serine/threonine protein kinase, partial [Planctomycetes bacterium]|nr:serine/threonine protein kinase [Planctomycetota bacterium]
MTIRFSCSCGKHISAPDTRAGKPGKCPQCGEPIVVPMPGGERAETLAGVRALLGVRPAGDRSTDTAELPPEEPENQLGRYPVTGSLGKGGMGEVLLVEDPELGRDLAAKVIRGTGHADGRLLEKFLLEAKITGRLEHPNIVPVHELGTAPDGRVYFTMKRVRGKDLAAILGELRNADCGLRNEKATTSGSKRRRAAGRESGSHKREGGGGPDELSLARLLEVFLKVCDAVAFAHSKGVIHRDLKPANVMVGEFGEVQV